MVLVFEKWEQNGGVVNIENSHSASTKLHCETKCNVIYGIQVAKAVELTISDRAFIKQYIQSR